MTFGFSDSSKNFRGLLFNLLRSVHFARIRLDQLSGQILHHDCISMIISRFTIFTKNLVICFGCATASSARDSCNCGPLTDFAISVFQEMTFNTMCTQILTYLECGLHRYFISVQELLHPPDFPSILVTTPGFQNLRDQREQVAPFYHGLLFVFGNFLVGSVKWLVIGFTADNGVAPFHHQHWNLTHTLKKYHFQCDPLSRVSLSLDVAVSGGNELGEDVEQWLSCLASVLLIDWQGPDDEFELEKDVG